MEMYTTTQPQPDPERFLNQFVSWEVATKENKWQGRNISRYVDPAADEAYRAAQKELDPVKRAAFFIKMNDIFCSANVILPIISRTRTAACSNTLVPNYSGWDADLWTLNSWYREA
jgi:peptide/nickel transport system substrate-binding protein